jgi:predicted  nucleic acid-binding Zn-ribbon protein
MGNIKDQLATLVVLQSVENNIRSIEKDLARVDERIHQLNHQIDEFSNNVHASQESYEQLKKQYRADESETRAIEGQIDHSNEKLRSVKTNKEYQSMLKEIDELKKKQSGIEDQMLHSLEQIEAAEKNTTVLKADLDDLRSEIEAQKEEIQSNAQAQRTDLEEAYARRDAVYGQLPVKIQTLVSKVMRQNNGVGVAGVLDEVCQVCRLNIPPQLFIELMRMQELLMCPHCQCLIYPQSLIENEDHEER